MARPRLQVMTPATTETRELLAIKAAPDASVSRMRVPLTLRPQPNPVPNATAPTTHQTRIVEEAISALQGHVRPDRFQGRRADARHIEQLIYRSEGSDLSAEVEDRHSGHGPNPGDRLEGGLVGGVQTH